MPITFEDNREAKEYKERKEQEGYSVKLEGNKVTIVGFTGTQKGMTEQQRQSVSELLEEIECKEAHHGDCIGADTDFHQIAKSKGIKLFGHPAKGVGEKRAYNKGFEEIAEEKSPLIRNVDIVEKSDLLIATPKGTMEERRSGTWATIRYAKKKGKKLIIINPDGTTGEFN